MGLRCWIILLCSIDILQTTSPRMGTSCVERLSGVSIVNAKYCKWLNTFSKLYVELDL